MAFDLDSLVKIGGQPQAQSLYTYKTDDGVSAVTASGYFNEAFGMLREDDYIIVRNTGEDYQIRITSSSSPITSEFKFRLTNESQTTGWVQVLDTTYTNLAPQTFTANTRTKLDLNADSIIESQAPFGTTAATFYDPVAKKLYGESVGDSYMVRLNFNCQPGANNTNLRYEVDIGGSVGFIFQIDMRLIRGTDEQGFSASDLIYTLDTFQANGGEIFLEFSSTTTVWGAFLVITRVHKGV